MFTWFRKNPTFWLLYGVFMLFTPVASLISHRLPSALFPKIYLMILWAFPLLILTKIKNIFNKIVCYVWIAWFLIGSINILASYSFYGNYYLINVEYANFIYLIFVTIFFGAILLFEMRAKKVEIKQSNDRQICFQFLNDIPIFFQYFLISFPFLWFISLYYHAGGIPLLKGTNIEESMYDTNFGPIYGFMAINILSMIFVFERMQRSTFKRAKLGYGVLVICFPLFSLANGKRMAVMVFLAGSLCYFIKVKGDQIFKKIFIVSGAVLAIILYCGVLILRQGFNFDTYRALDVQLAIIGVEFRDFAYAIDKFNQDMLKNYSWAISTFASCVNTKVLELIGIDKQKALEMSLGYVTKPLFSGGVFGIRTGLVSELFFAYQFWGLGIIFMFGLVTSWVSIKLQQTRAESSFIFLSVVYALLLLVIVEQSIDVAGTLTVLGYAWIIYALVKMSKPVNSNRWILWGK